VDGISEETLLPLTGLVLRLPKTDERSMGLSGSWGKSISIGLLPTNETKRLARTTDAESENMIEGQAIRADEKR
jgi:hypothetical protein